jgi:hypothetical protein
MSKKIVKKASKKLPKKSPLGKMNSKDTSSVLRELINAKKEYEICVEQELTKRQDIQADLTKYMLNINLKRDAIFSVLEEEYKIRRETIAELGKILDQAYEDGRDEVVIQAISSIEGIIKESPAKGLLYINEALSDPQKELII